MSLPPSPFDLLIETTETNEAAIETCIEYGDALSIDTARAIADLTINTLISNLSKRMFTPGKKRIIAEHLTALGIIAIERTEDILSTLEHAGVEINTEGLIVCLCEMRMEFAASGCDEAEWIVHIADKFHD